MADSQKKMKASIFMQSISKYQYASVFLLAIAISGCGTTRRQPSSQIMEMAQKGEAYYDEKCKTVAGGKIYRTVTDVEGIFLMKIRPRKTETQLKDPMWPGATFTHESSGDGYISSFLDYEQPISAIGVGHIPFFQKNRGGMGPQKNTRQSQWL